MKTGILTLLLCVMSVFCFGQDSVIVSNVNVQNDSIVNEQQPKENHLIFKGMPIDGNVNYFVGLFINDGYQYIETGGAKGVGIQGMFAGKDCQMLISSTPNTHTVYQVLVSYGENCSFYTAKSNYNNLVSIYTNKYGVPSNNVKSFSKPYYEGDGYENTAMRLGKVKYISMWKLTEGTILIMISNSGKLIIEYEDAINSKLNKVEEQEHISFDI